MGDIVFLPKYSPKEGEISWFFFAKSINWFTTDSRMPAIQLWHWAILRAIAFITSTFPFDFVVVANWILYCPFSVLFEAHLLIYGSGCSSKIITVHLVPKKMRLYFYLQLLAQITGSFWKNKKSLWLDSEIVDANVMQKSYIQIARFKAQIKQLHPLQWIQANFPFNCHFFLWKKYKDFFIPEYIFLSLRPILFSVDQSSFKLVLSLEKVFFLLQEIFSVVCVLPF